MQHSHRTTTSPGWPKVSLAGLVLLAGCGAHVAGPGSSPDGDRIVVVATATANEPRPALTAAVVGELQAAAESTNASDGRNGKGSVAVVASADGVTYTSLPLTPRRANGAVEHGLQRDSLIQANLARVSGAVGGLAARKSGVDLLEGIGNAVQGRNAGELVVISSGLSTDGGFDLRKVGWAADPAAIAAELRTRDLLPKLGGWKVLFTGLGATAGAQAPLPAPARDRLEQYWRAICVASGAASCEVDGSRFDRQPPNAAPATPAVDVPGIASVTGPDGLVHATFSNDVLGFAGDSAALSPAAQDVLKEYAQRIVTALAARPAAAVTVRGYTADPPGSTQQGRATLSRQRAQAVSDALRVGGVTNSLAVSGGGTAPGLSAVAGGTFNEAVAAQMRRVEITY